MAFRWLDMDILARDVGILAEAPRLPFPAVQVVRGMEKVKRFLPPAE